MQLETTAMSQFMPALARIVATALAKIWGHLCSHFTFHVKFSGIQMPVVNVMNPH